MCSSPSSAIKKDNVPLAAGIITLTVLALSLGDALIKLTSDNFVIWQIFVIRSIIAIPCLLIFMAIWARDSFKIPIALGWTMLRSLLLVLMWISYYISLPHLALSIAATAYYTLPIFITLFSAVFIGESISRRGWIAVVIGFSGILLILRPSVVDFNWYALLPLLSAILYALAMVLTRSKCRTEHPITLALALNIAFALVGGVVAACIVTLPDEIRHGFLLAPWAVMEPLQWGSMGLLALAILVGSIGTAIAYQISPPSTIGIFDFTYVGFAVIWGVVFFSEIPDGMSILGIVFIVVAGIISLQQ